MRGFFVQHLGASLIGLERDNFQQFDARRKFLWDLVRNDRHPYVRREAFNALANTGDRDVLDMSKKIILEQAVEFEFLTDLSIHYLYENDEKSMIPAMRSLIESTGSPMALVAAINVLGKWDDTDSRNLIEKYLNASNPILSRAAKKSIRSNGTIIFLYSSLPFREKLQIKNIYRLSEFQKVIRHEYFSLQTTT